MAARYWVGGTAAWDGTAGSKWALTSGGAGGQAEPTLSDDVFFDAASGAVTVTVSTTTAICQNLNFTGFTGTITGSINFSIYGNLTIVSGMTWSATGTVFLQALSGSSTVTTAGKLLQAVNFGLSGTSTATWTLQDALTTSNAVTVTSGTFTTNNFAVTASQLSSTSSNTRTINLGSSTLTLSSTPPINFLTSTNLTFNAGTSQINCTNTSSIAFNGGGVSFYNVAFTGIPPSAGYSRAIVGANTFNNLSVTALSTANIVEVTFDSRTTINGTLSTTGTAGNRRVWFRGITEGIAQILTINSAASLTDADFRDIYVIGTAAPISGTRIGNLRGCSGINFSTPKTVYWNAAASANWSDDVWAATSGGSTSTNNFPLAQDTAIFNNASAGNQLILNSAIGYVPSVDFSARTVTFNVNFFQANTCYGNWTFGSGVTTTSSSTLTFSGRNTQTITSAGIAFSGSIFIDSYGGTVQLADALNNGSNNVFSVTNGTFDTKNYNLTTGGVSSNNSNVRTILFGSSTISIASTVFNLSSTNLTFNSGTSQITMSNTASFTFTGGSQTFYNVSFTGVSVSSIELAGTNTFNNLLFTPHFTAGIKPCILSANQTINGTLTVAAATAVRRIFLQSNTLGTTRTLTVNSLSATDCDFRDITLAGAAAGSSPIRAGDCGGNTGITFPSAKTVYWNLAGTQVWSATAWALESGGTPDINQFPLAQDTAVFNDAGSAGTIQFQTFNIGTINASARTSAVTLSYNATSSIYGNYILGSGVTTTNGNGHTFSGRGTQTITSAGKTLSFSPTIDCFTGTVQLADALLLDSGRSLFLSSGTFNAVTYNVTVTSFTPLSFTNTTLRMGSGTWTLTGTGNVWMNSSAAAAFYKGTANIVLSDTSTSARTFNGAGFSYNKLTIGGTTGTSTTTIQGNNQFTELASTKTVAHTIALGTTTLTFGAWTVSGTVGNVVTVTGTSTITIAGARVSGVDYFALGTTTISATSPGEFYAGANSTGGTNAILTAAPAAVTRYWRGGSGTWDVTTTTNWSATSGGSGGASVPTSADAVVFDTMSNATAYTVTCTATQLRCASFTMAGPATGNVTWAGTAPIAMHDNVSLAATGITRSYTGAITLSGSSTGRTLTTNGNALSSSQIVISGQNSEWSLGSALNCSTMNAFIGTFNTANYNITAAQLTLGVDLNTNTATTPSTLNLGSSTITLSNSNPFNVGFKIDSTFNAATSQITITNASPTFAGSGKTFYNVSFTDTTAGTVILNGANTFNNLSFTGITASGLKVVSVAANQTINGTLTISAGTNATMRLFVRSDTIGTTRTLTCAAFSGTDVDFRDITIAGAAAPVSGTRLGDCKGNSGITFVAGKTVYFGGTGGGLWGGSVWNTTGGSGGGLTDFPLAQDTAIFQATVPNTGTTVTINAAYNIGTIDMSARTSNTMTLETSTNAPFIHGNWINGTGTTLSGTGTLTFAGRGSQTITSAGVTWTQTLTVNTPGGSATLQDAFNSNFSGTALFVTAGTINANGYNVTLSNSGANINTSNSNVRTISIGAGTWTIAGAGNAWNAATSTSLTVTGTGTISLTSASAKNFQGGGISYSGITLNQGGAGVLTITGDNTFKDITNTYSTTGATNITLNTTTQRVTQFTGTGASGRVLTIQGTSASSPGTLILTGATKPNVNYLAITGVRAYSLTDTWYAGANSTNNGSLGWIFSSYSPPTITTTGKFLLLFG